MAGVSREAIMVQKHHAVKNVKIESNMLSLVVDGQFIQRKLRDISSVLDLATEQEQKSFEISPSGYGIHWPLIDEDLSIDGLLGIGRSSHLNTNNV